MTRLTPHRMILPVIVALAAPAHAAAPAPSLAASQQAANAAIAACQGTPIAVAVIDSSGLPRLVQVSDGALALFGQFALRKAATALRYGKPSKVVRDDAATNPALAEQLKTDPALIGFGGGMPFAGGAIAVAGAPSQDIDQRCAEAGLALLVAPKP